MVVNKTVLRPPRDPTAYNDRLFCVHGIRWRKTKNHVILASRFIKPEVRKESTWLGDFVVYLLRCVKIDQKEIKATIINIKIVFIKVIRVRLESSPFATSLPIIFPVIPSPSYFIPALYFVRSSRRLVGQENLIITTLSVGVRTFALMQLISRRARKWYTFEFNLSLSLSLVTLKHVIELATLNEDPRRHVSIYKEG